MHTVRPLDTEREGEEWNSLGEGESSRLLDWGERRKTPNFVLKGSESSGLPPLYRATLQYTYLLFNRLKIVIRLQSVRHGAP